MKFNARWHAAHRMANNATLDERVRWHLAHAAACACREMPPRIAAEIRRRKAGARRRSR